jgi:hypothetical protein
MEQGCDWMLQEQSVFHREWPYVAARLVEEHAVDFQIGSG